MHALFPMLATPFSRPVFNDAIRREYSLDCYDTASKAWPGVRTE